MPEQVVVFEMGPRDGLQNEKKIIPAADKIKLVNKLSDCNFRKIEVTSFVSPKWVPQMADALEVLNGIDRYTGVIYSALTPNMKGLHGAFEAHADEVAVFASASEGFSQKNINCSIAESIERFRPVVEAALDRGTPVRGYVSCVVKCPYDGDTPPEEVARVAKLLLDLGCYEVSLGDTIGAGTPETIEAMLNAVLNIAAAGELAGHYHDTNGRALENIEVSLEKGLRTFDSAIAGLGGCPYAPGAKGNVDTGSVVALCHKKGFSTGVDEDKLLKAAAFAKELIGE